MFRVVLQLMLLLLLLLHGLLLLLLGAACNRVTHLRSLCSASEAPQVAIIHCAQVLGSSRNRHSDLQQRSSGSGREPQCATITDRAGSGSSSSECGACSSVAIAIVIGLQIGSIALSQSQ